MAQNKFIKGLTEKLTMLAGDWFVIQPDAEESIAYKIKQSNALVSKLDKSTTEPNTWYVNSNTGKGSDLNVGSDKFPFKNISKALSVMASYDIIHIQDQFYSSSEAINTNGKVVIIKGPFISNGSNGITISGVWTVGTSRCTFENINLTASFISSGLHSIEVANSYVDIDALTGQNTSLSLLDCEVFWESGVELRDLFARGSFIEGADINIGVLLRISSTTIINNIVTNIDATGSTTQLRNSTIEGDLTVTGDLEKYNSVVTGTETVSGTTTEESQTQSQGQSVAFSESIKAYNPPGFFPDYTQTGVLNFTKDASVGDNAGYGNGVHGMINANGDAVNFTDDFDRNEITLQAGESYLFTALWRGLRFSTNFIKVIGSEAQKVVDRMSNLSTQEEDAITDFVNAEVAAGNWGLIDEFYCLALNSTDWLTGFKTKTAINNGASRTSDGALFAGAEWIDSSFNPLADGINYGQDSAIAGAFVYNDVSIATYSVYAGFNTLSPQPRTQLTLGSTTIFFDHNFAGGGNSGTGSIANKTLNVIDRSTSVLTTRYVDGVSVATNIHASDIPAAANIGIGAQNTEPASTQSFYFTGTISTWMAGGSTGFNHVSHNTNVRQLLTDLGITL